MEPVMRPIELHRITPFATLTPPHRAALAAVARSSVHRHGERLWQTGDPCVDVIVLVDGFVRLFRLSSDGTETTTDIVRSGSLLAVTALHGGTVHDNSAEVLGRAHTVEIPATTVLGLAGESPQLFAEIARCLVARTDAVYAGAAIDAQESLPSRLLYVLRRLARPDPADHGIEDRALAGVLHPLAMRLSHAEAGRLVGADRTSVTRAFRQLVHRGLIRRERGHVTGVALAASGCWEHAWDGEGPSTTCR